MNLTQQGILQRAAIRAELIRLAFKRMLLAEPPLRRLTDEERQILRENKNAIRTALLQEFTKAEVDAAIGRAKVGDEATSLKVSLVVKGAEAMGSGGYADWPRGKAGDRPESGSQTLPTEFLHESHATRIVQALEHLGRGQDTLKVMLDQRAGPVDNATSPAADRPRAPTVQDQGGPRGRPGGYDAAREQGRASPVNPVNLRQALSLEGKHADALLPGDFRSQLLKDCGEVFALVVEARASKTRRAVADPQSAANADLKGLVTALISGASELVEKAVRSKMSSSPENRRR